jgi:hypothetical protein
MTLDPHSVAHLPTCNVPGAVPQDDNSTPPPPPLDDQGPRRTLTDVLGDLPLGDLCAHQHLREFATRLCGGHTPENWMDVIYSYVAEEFDWGPDFLGGLDDYQLLQLTQQAMEREMRSPVYSSDFRSAFWRGTEYRFTPTQANCIQILWEAQQRKTPVMGQAAILEELETKAHRLLGTRSADHVLDTVCRL